MVLNSACKEFMFISFFNFVSLEIYFSSFFKSFKALLRFKKLPTIICFCAENNKVENRIVNSKCFMVIP